MPDSILRGELLPVSVRVIKQRNEVNVTTIVSHLGLERTKQPLCTSTIPVEVFNTSFSTHSSVGMTGPGLSSPLRVLHRETRYTSD